MTSTSLVRNLGFFVLDLCKELGQVHAAAFAAGCLDASRPSQRNAMPYQVKHAR
jgi:hypothetical protein